MRQTKSVQIREQANRIAELEIQNWNLKHPPGTPVTYWTGLREGPGKQSKTNSKAQMMCGHPVVWVDGHSSCISLTQVQPAKL